MNDQLKDELLRVSWQYVHENPAHPEAAGESSVEGFKSGAEWLYNQGYRFTEEDMRAAFNAGVAHMDEDAWADSVGYKRKHPGFDQWLEERRKGQ